MSASTAPSIQYSWDGPGTLGAGQDALYPRWNNATGRFEMASAGVSDHGGLTGLGDDDHAQYALLAGRSGGQTLIGGTGSGEGLTLTSTSHATKGALTLGASQVFVPDGTLSLPGMSFAADPNTGVYRIGSDSVGVVVAGALAWQIANSSVTTICRPISASQVPLAARGLASQTANLQEWQDSAGTVLTHVKPDGRVAIGALALGATLASGGSFVWRMGGGSDTFAFQNGSSVPYLTLSNTATNQLLAAALTAAKTPLTVDGAAAQTANLTEWRNSAGTVLARVTAGGILALDAASPQLYFGATAPSIKLGGGGTLTIKDNGEQTLATFVSNAGGTLRNAGTTRIEWNATGIGFFATTPVAKQAFIADPSGGATVDAEARTAITAVITALENYGLLATS